MQLDQIKVAFDPTSPVEQMSWIATCGDDRPDVRGFGRTMEDAIDHLLWLVGDDK